MQSAIAEGRVLHRRHLPRPHRLQYRQWMVLQDLDAVPAELAQPSLWRRFSRAGLRLRRSDYLQPHHMPQSAAVRQLVAEHTGQPPEGKIFLLGHLRQWGYCFNPVVFYFCHNQAGQLQAIVAEITNTPWAERHQYILPVKPGEYDSKSYNFRFSKDFHVSPFLPMELDYEWTFTFYRSRIGIFMAVNRAQQRMFDASLGLRLKPYRQLAQSPWKHPLQCQRVSFGIYWHALLLWLKKLRVFPHPERSKAATDTLPGGE